jgi:hypothetical protein
MEELAQFMLAALNEATEASSLAIISREQYKHITAFD